MRVRKLLPKDAIASVDEPAFGGAYFGDPADEVVVVEDRAGPARAYPLRVLHHHEVVNDVLAAGPGPADGGADGGDEPAGDAVPVAVTWCPICASAVVYDRHAGDDVLEFGVSGKLADDALVLYDRLTGSEWKQSSGECIDGVHEGTTLRVLPAGVMPVERFRTAHPDGRVLDPVGSDGPVGTDPEARKYYDTGPYEAYFERPDFGYEAMQGREGAREWERDDLSAKATVLGLGEGDDAVGVPYPVVREAGGVVEVTVGDRDVVAVATEDALAAFEAPDFPLSLDGAGAAGPARLRGDGTTWTPATGRSADGRRLGRVPSRRLYAFAWQDDHGPDSFYER